MPGAIVITLVVLARFAVPLTIPRFPLPGILAALILDAVDQTIFQWLGVGDDAGNYQSYDKALDVYYLAIAYIATLRNWTNAIAFETGRFLWYYRLVGVAAFELASWRPMLLIFPNVFEYFFILYSLVRLRWDPRRLSREFVLGAAAFLWIGVKLPQEYWIHVAKLDTTDLIKERVLGADLDTGWIEALGNNLWVFPVLAALAGGATWLGRQAARRLPPEDWRFSFSAAVDAPEVPLEARRPLERQPKSWLAEKIVLVSFLTFIFAQILPNLDARPILIVAGVSVVIVFNSFVSHWFAVRGTRWSSTLVEFLVMAAFNYAGAVAYIFFLPGGEVGGLVLLFLTLLLTLIVVLYDHYRQIHDYQMARPRPTPGAGPLVAGPIPAPTSSSD